MTDRDELIQNAIVFLCLMVFIFCMIGHYVFRCLDLAR